MSKVGHTMSLLSPLHFENFCSDQTAGHVLNARQSEIFTKCPPVYLQGPPVFTLPVISKFRD